MNPVAKRLYDRLPSGLQNLMVSGFGWWLDRNRYSGRFVEYQEFLEESQWWSPSELKDWQNERLSGIIKHAYTEVPYYQRRFAEHGVNPQDIRTQDDLHKLPVLTRKEIVDNFGDLVARNVNRNSLQLGTQAHYGFTPGSAVRYRRDGAHLCHARPPVPVGGDTLWAWRGSRCSAPR